METKNKSGLLNREKAGKCPKAPGSLYINVIANGFCNMEICRPTTKSLCVINRIELKLNPV